MPLEYLSQARACLSGQGSLGPIAWVGLALFLVIERRSSGSGRRADVDDTSEIVGLHVLFGELSHLKFKLLAKMAASVSHFKRTSVAIHPSFIVIHVLDLIGIDGSLAKMARCKPFPVTSPVAALCCLPPLLAALGYVFFMTGT